MNRGKNKNYDELDFQKMVKETGQFIFEKSHLEC